MKHRSVGPVQLIAAVLGILALALLVGRHYPSASAPSGLRTFRMNLSTEPPTLDWSLATDSVSFTVITNLMEGLTEYDDDLRPRPAAAERWEVSGDGKTYTFYLRPGLQWTDGRPVTAGDFVYSWRRLLDPKTGAQYAYFLYDVVNARDYNSGKITDPALVGVRAIDDRTLEVRLEKALVYFPSLTTFMVTFPQREDMVRKYGDSWTDPGRLVTNGPFLLSEWRHEYKLSLVANPAYRTGKPRLDRVEMFVVNEPTTALTLYETGDLDMVNLTPEAMAAYRDSPERRSIPLLRGNYYGFNIHRPPFDDVRVRRAFARAVDRGEIVRILNGGEIPTASWIPPGMFGYDPEIGLDFDPDAARRLLAEAGYPGGKGFGPVTAVFNTGSVNRLVAENLQSQWKRTLNVPVELDNMEWKVYLRLLDTDPPGLFRLSWGADYPDPDNFMSVFISEGGNNRTKWGNRRFDELLARGTSEFDPSRRMEIYNEAQRILVEEETAIIPLFVSVQNTLIKPDVKNLNLNAMELLNLRDVSFEGGP